MFAEPAPDENDPRDPSTRAGNLRIKAQIEDYWAKRGYRVKLEVVRAGFSQTMRCSHHALRSPGFVNGMPPPESAQ